ncbi:MAG: hypothetical protein WD709_07320, partial [Gammaproteobacteria bacterium]
ALVFMHGISSSALAAGDRTELRGDCSYPEKPAVVDGSTATEAQMINSQKALKDYLALGNEFLACLEKEEGELTAEAAKENAERVNQTYNAVVDEMNAAAEEFNTSLGAYRAQNQ